MGAQLSSHDETVERAPYAPGAEDFKESAIMGGARLIVWSGEMQNEETQRAYVVNSEGGASRFGHWAIASGRPRF